jgi:hypothetical protein
MPFSGQTSNTILSASLQGEDVSALVYALMPKESPFLDWLGEPTIQAGATKHEFIEDFLLPNYITCSVAVNSATAATGIQINGLGLALTVGTLLENESAAPELLQITSIPGANSILVSRAYGGSTTGSLVAGSQLFVRGMAALEGQDHSGAHTARLGNRRANTVGYFNIELAASGTQLALAAKQLGRDTYGDAQGKLFVDAPAMLEKELLRGVLNSTNSLGTSTATRTMQGIRAQLTTIASAITATSFAADPHLYVGNVWEQAFVQGASPTEAWGIVAGRTFFKNLSDLNDTKVTDSNASESFKRVIRTYTGPFGQAEIFLSRWLPATELLIVPRERIRPVVLRPWSFLEMAQSGDNKKGALVGEYSVEVHHANAMARLYV